MRRIYQVALGTVACLVAGCSGAASQGEELTLDPIVSGCEQSLTDNDYLLVPALDGVAHQPVSCAVPMRGPPEVKLVELGTPSGLKIAIGHAGQIYGIRVPGIEQDLIATQRIANPYMDEVLQTVATNVALHHASPRYKAQQNRDFKASAQLPGWDMHQAGAYERGALVGKRPVYGPLLYEHLDAASGELTTMSLAVLAHPQAGTGDRFVVLMRLRALDTGTFMLSQTWISYARQAGTPLALDYFNFPWMVLRDDAVPATGVQTASGWIDTSNLAFGQAANKPFSDAQWLGAFADDTPTAPGMGVVLAADGAMQLRLGTHPAVGLIGDDLTDPEPNARETLYVVEASRKVAPLEPGEAITSQMFLLFGDRASVARRAAALQPRAFVQRFSTAPTGRPSDLVDLCGQDRLRLCTTGESRRIAIIRTFCTTCLPLFELQRGGTFVYSTEPFLNSAQDMSLSDPVYRIDRIVGWLPPASLQVPKAYTAVSLNAPGSLIVPAEGDVGNFVYYR